MEYILVYGISILVGWVARYWKNRNGIVWGMLTFALMLPLIPFYMMGNQLLVSLGAIAVGIFVVGCMSVLPATKACPFCKRRIHADAMVCSHCKSNLNEEASGNDVTPLE